MELKKTENGIEYSYIASDELHNIKKLSERIVSFLPSLEKATNEYFANGRHADKLRKEARELREMAEKITGGAK